GRVCGRGPPRRPDEMSSSDDGLASRASPARARSLFTVRAAISSAVSSVSPRSRSPSLMCSYWRSRLSDHDLMGAGVGGMEAASFVANELVFLSGLPSNGDGQTVAGLKWSLDVPAF